jgi:hypothetical protein
MDHLPTKLAKEKFVILLALLLQASLVWSPAKSLPKLFATFFC